MARITESQLVLPALYLMSKSERGFISTSELIARLTAIMHPTGIDAQILSGRTDTYFSQKVRNLKSHDTLVRQNYATNYADGFQISPKGVAYVESHMDAIDYLLRNKIPHGDLVLINKYGKVRIVSYKDIKNHRYSLKIKGFL